MANTSSNKKETSVIPPVRLIYCGPNIPGGALQQYAVFKGGFPEYLNGLFEKCPAIKSLFVPVEELAATMQAIETRGTLQNVLFEQIKDAILKGGVR